jgi:hypothetical protein
MALALEVIRTDTGARERFTFDNSPVRIGRSPLNNVVLAAPWVSLHHGLIHFDDQQATYSDLGSTNGTTVVMREHERRLHPMVPLQILGGAGAEAAGAELRVGAISLRVEWERAGAGTMAGLAPAPGTGGASKQKYETRLTMGDLKAFQNELRNQVPVQAQAAPPPGRGPAPAYQAGFTRLVAGDEAAAVAFPAPPTPAPTPGAAGTGGPVLDVLGRVSMAWNDGSGVPPRFSGSDKAFVETLAAVADAFARGLIELKKGLSEFGEGIGVRAVGGHSPLHRSQTAGEVMAYLMAPGADVHARLEQLVDLFADLMIHEVALLNGVKAGVRQLLAELDPEGGYRQSAEGKGGKAIALFDRSLRRYHEFFQSVTEDGGESIVFGSEFAHAYAQALGGERSPGRRRS